MADGTVAIDPLFTHDGRRVIYETRSTATDTGLGTLWMVNVDGSGLVPADHRATPGHHLVRALARRAVDRVRVVDRRHGIDLVRESRRLGPPDARSWRSRRLDRVPPAGRQAARCSRALRSALTPTRSTWSTRMARAFDPSSRPASEVYTDAVWSADGTHVLYSWADNPCTSSPPTAPMTASSGRARPAGSARRRSRPMARRSSSSAPTTLTGWSRASSGPTGPAPPVDITGAVLETGSRYQWSPDSTVILARPNEISSQQQLWDPTTGQARIAPWPAQSYPTWQRLAP